MLFRSIVFIALMGFAAYPAQAALFEQALPDPPTLDGIFSNSGKGVAADDFEPEQVSTVTGVTWYGYYSATISEPSSVSFTIDFLSNSSYDNKPGGPIVSQQSVEADLTELLKFTNETIYKSTAKSFSPVIIDATKMWLSVVEDDSSKTDWSWNRCKDTAGSLA